MSESWRGIYPITAFVRDALRRKATDEQSMALSEAEETLLTACEFWSAANTGSLIDLLRTEPVVELMRAQMAFTRIEAVRVASALRVAVTELTRVPIPEPIANVAARLEDRLAQTEDPVDGLIARYAIERMDLRSPSPDQGSRNE